MQLKVFVIVVISGHSNMTITRKIHWAWGVMTLVIAAFFYLVQQFIDLANIDSVRRLSFSYSWLGRELISAIILFLVFVILIAYTRLEAKSLRTLLINRGRGNILLLVISALIITSCIAIILYNGRYLIIGNIIQYKQLHGIYLVEAQRLFEKSELDATEEEILTCIDITRREKCKEILDEIKAMKGFIKDANQLVDEYATDLDGTYEILNDLSSIDKDSTRLDEFIKRVEDSGVEALTIYVQAINALELGDIKTTKNKLDKVEKIWNDFAHNRILYKEISDVHNEYKESPEGNLNLKEVNTSKYPYLNAFTTLGASEFIRKTTASYKEKLHVWSLKRNMIR